MIHSNIVPVPDNTDELPAPAAVTVPNPSASTLPRPVSSQPDIADSGRIVFGHGMRILSK